MICVSILFNFCLYENEFLCAFIKIPSLSLSQKPILVTFAKDEDFSISLPKPPADAAEVRKVSSARAHLFRRNSQGNCLSAKVVPPDQSKNVLVHIIS